MKSSVLQTGMVRFLFTASLYEFFLFSFFFLFCNVLIGWGSTEGLWQPEKHPSIAAGQARKILA